MSRDCPGAGSFGPVKSTRLTATELVFNPDLPTHREDFRFRWYARVAQVIQEEHECCVRLLKEHKSPVNLLERKRKQYSISCEDGYSKAPEVNPSYSHLFGKPLQDIFVRFTMEECAGVESVCRNMLEVQSGSL